MTLRAVGIAGSATPAVCYTEWFGADNTGVLDSTAAFNAACAFAHANGDIPIQLLSGTYKLTSTVILNGTASGSFTHPNLLGVSKKKTILSYAGIASGTPAIQLKGGSGQISGGIVRDITFLGDTNSIGLEFLGQCGSKAVNCLFSTNAVGVRWHNSLSNTFTEFCTLEGCEWANACILSMEYKITSGNNSFHGSGPGGGAENVVNNNNGIVVQADGTGCFIYNAPSNLQVFATLANTVIFQNNNSVAPVPISFSGTLSIETNSSRTVTLGAGAGIYFAGPIKVIGMTTATGANVVAGTLLRVKTVQVYADSSCSITGAENGRQVALTVPSASMTGLSLSGPMNNLARITDVSVSATNYKSRQFVAGDYFGDGSTAAGGAILAQTANFNNPGGTLGYQAITAYTGSGDGSLNITVPTVAKVATGSFAGGETSATLTLSWQSPTGTYNWLFSNGNVRAVACTQGSAGPFSWTGGLGSAATTALTCQTWPVGSGTFSAYVYETQQSNGIEGAGHMQF